MSFDVAYPSQVVLVSSRGMTTILGKEMTKDNMLTVAWHCPLSFEPKLYGVSIGKTRFSYQLIKESKVFAVNFLSHDLKEKALFCGRNSGMSIDKFSRSGLTKAECETIDCPRVKEAAAYIECEVIDELDAGDHVLFIGKITKEATNNDKKRLLYLGTEQFSSTL